MQKHLFLWILYDRPLSLSENEEISNCKQLGNGYILDWVLFIYLFIYMRTFKI